MRWSRCEQLASATVQADHSTSPAFLLYLLANSELEFTVIITVSGLDAEAFCMGVSLQSFLLSTQIHSGYVLSLIMTDCHYELILQMRLRANSTNVRTTQPWNEPGAGLVKQRCNCAS